MPKKKFYIASTLSNVENVAIIADKFLKTGWQWSFNWTPFSSLGNLNSLKEISQNEVNGVLDCDLFLMLFPAQRGSHVELGIALAAGKPILLLAPDENALLRNGLTCSFYHHPKVNLLIQKDIEILACLALQEGEKLLTGI